MSRKLAVSLFFPLVFLSLSGCSGGSNSGGGSNPINPITTTLAVSLSTLSAFSANLGSTASQTLTISNTGSAALILSGVAVTTPSAFTLSNACGTSIAAGASCNVTVTFTPTTTGAASATITITDNAANSPQTVALTGTGNSTAPAVTYQLYMLPDPGAGAGSGTMAALYALVNNAKKTIDMTMYALKDTTFSGDLVAACQRGVTVRVILDQNSEKSMDQAAYNQINAQANCSAVWANTAFSVTHQKSIIIDGSTLALMSLNLQSQYYSTTRDFAMIYNDPADIAAVQATFNMDYAAGTPASGVAGASDFSYIPGTGTDLIWSPTTAKASMESIINGSATTLIIDAEELLSSAGYIVTDIANACTRGVTVRATIENESHAYDTQFATLKAAGCSVHYYSSSTGYYVHAKSVIADYGLPTQKAYMGSINYSNASMTANRELGMFISDNASVQTLYTAMVADYNNATGIY